MGNIKCENVKVLDCLAEFCPYIFPPPPRPLRKGGWFFADSAIFLLQKTITPSGLVQNFPKDVGGWASFHILAVRTLDVIPRLLQWGLLCKIPSSHLFFPQQFIMAIKEIAFLLFVLLNIFYFFNVQLGD
jgi:hypothetical protein